MQDFITNIELLKAYVAEHGSFPPRAYRDPTTNRLLGRWLAVRRDKYKKGDLSPGTEAALTEAFGDDWKEPIHQQLPFEEVYDKLVAFMAETGSMPVRSSKSEDGYLIGIWTKNRRADYRKGTLLPERIAQLEQIPGWDWEESQSTISYRPKISFDESLKICKEFVRAHGRQPSYKDDGDDERLDVGRWVSRQRTRKRDGKLSQEQIGALESIPGWWWEWDAKAQEPLPSSTKP